MFDHMKTRRMGCGPTGAPSVSWASGPLAAVQAADREIGRQTARRARAVAEFAATRPASLDRPADQPGAMSAERRAARPQVVADVSEWAAQELVIALSITSQAAEALLERSLTLVHRLPGTLAALESGRLNPGHLWAMLEHIATVGNDRLRAELEAELLSWVARRSVTTGTQLTAKARRLVLARDARAAARRLTEALTRRGVTIRPGAADGMALVAALLTVPEAQALMDALNRYVDSVEDDPADTRSRGQKMADCLLDLVLRPGESGLAPVQAQLTVVASIEAMAGGDQPGEVGGQPVSAEMVRALARGLGLIPDDAEPPDESRADLEAGHVDAEAIAREERALGDWWHATELRVLAEGWRGAEDPPLAEKQRWWADQARFDRMTPHDRWEPDDIEPDGPGVTSSAEELTVLQEAPPDGVAPVSGVGCWASADRAVGAAGVALLELDRAMGLARGAVENAERADALDEEAWRHSRAGRLTTAADSLAALAGMSAEQRSVLADLLDRSAGGGLADRPRIAVRDVLTGALLALTDSVELRRAARAGGGQGPPADSPGYRPGTRLDRYIRARDRRCRFPGCRAPVPRGGELDHDLPYPDGATSATNLTGYCTRHHRGKHQAPGFRHELARDGTLTVTTPSGLVAVTTPPDF